MPSSEPSEDKTLFERASVQEARTLLSDAARTSAETLIWHPSQDDPLSTTFGQISERENIFRLPRPATAFKGASGQSYVFSVKIQKANFFFRTDYLGHDDDLLHFSYPTKVFKVQRRKARRFRVPADLFIKVEFQDLRPPHGKLSEKVYDLSREGLSFIVNDNPSSAYKRGARIESLTLLLERKKLSANVIVLNARALPAAFREKGVRIGVRFTAMADKDANMLGAFVEREIQKQLAKRL